MVENIKSLATNQQPTTVTNMPDCVISEGLNRSRSLHLQTRLRKTQNKRLVLGFYLLFASLYNRPFLRDYRERSEIKRTQTGRSGSSRSVKFGLFGNSPYFSIPLSRLLLSLSYRPLPCPLDPQEPLARFGHASHCI